MNGYGLWDQWYGLTPAEQAAQKSKSQGFSFSQSTIPAAQSSVVGTNTGANAWTIDSQGNIVKPAGQTGFGGTGSGYSDLGAGNTYDCRNTGQSTTSTTDNPFSDWTVGELDSPGAERAAYYSSFAGKGFGEGSPAKRRFFESSFDQIYSDYLGKLGQQIRGSKEGISTEPLKWTDYLRDDPFTERYSNLTPSERGEYLGRYSPSARRIYF